MGSSHDARFLVVGGGDLHNALVELARELGITDKVTFTGLIDDVDSVYQTLDVLVQPSDTEGTPRTVVEAMAHGVPVVATDVGDVAELLDHGRCGVLTRPGDVEGLTAAVAELLANPDQAQQLAKHGRERYLRRYTIEAMATQVRDAYQAAITLAANRTQRTKATP